MRARYGLLLAALAASGCTEPAGNALTCGEFKPERPVLVLGSDFVASALGRLGADGCLTEIPDLTLGGDASLSIGNAGPFVSVRVDGVVYAVDPETLSLTRTWVSYGEDEAKFQMPCGNAGLVSNPHDADLDAAGRLWVARYDQPTIGVVEPDGSFGGTVDLGSFADSDGLPEVEAIRVVGARVYAAVDRLDRCALYKPAGPGRIAVIDAEKREVTGAIELGGANPFGRMISAPWDPSGSTVAIALPGSFSAIDDGDAAAIVDLASGAVQGFGKESSLGGSIAEVAPAAPDEAYAIVAGPEQANATRVVRLDPATGEVVATLADSRDEREGGGYCHVGLAIVGAHVLVGSKPPCAPAILAFDRETGRKAGAIQPERLPPLSLVPLP
ncbi:YncE family protein [Polyangium aurulentum]|uniref:YncE family protein n=1 Tax=Polyangium aurulentum TaxID=2567896 RepID=UPI0010ADBA3B|nr:hypothetical protein [Polyangium aurulentum]UQA55130.1 hypothetical protein E8A73_027710 [Polyangium aurulentum]